MKPPNQSPQMALTEYAKAENEQFAGDPYFAAPPAVLLSY